MNERDQLLFLHRKSEILFSLRDDFTDTRSAGAVDGTPATPGPGVRDKVTDGNNKLSVGSGVLNFATGGVGAFDPAIWYEQITRISGRILIAKFTPADNGQSFRFGFDTNQSPSVITDSFSFGVSVLRITKTSGAGVIFGSYTPGTSYYLCLISRALGIYFFIKGGTEYPNWTLLTFSSTGSTSLLYPTIATIGNASVLTSDFIRVPLQKWLSTPIAYDTFTRTNGAIGSTEATGPDGQQAPVKAWTGVNATVLSNKAVITPTQGGEELVNPGFEGIYGSGQAPNTILRVNGGNVSENGVTFHGGSKAQNISYGPGRMWLANSDVAVSIGGWYVASGWVYVNSGSPKFKVRQGDNSFPILLLPSGASWIQYMGIYRATHAVVGVGVDCETSGDVILDDTSIKPLTLSTLFSSLEASKTDVLVTAIPSAFFVGTQMGVVTHMDDAANPANLLLSYIDGTNIHFVKCVGGVYTPLISTAQAYVSGKLPLIIAWRDGADLMARLYYDDAFIGTEQTISDAGIIDNTLIGKFSTYDGNKFDSFLSFPRGQNDASHAALNGFIT